MSVSRSLHLRGALSAAQIEMVDGREHLVVPVVALMEGAIHAVNAKSMEFVSAKTLAKAPESWNGHPLVLGHPSKDGKQISAHDPLVLEKHGFGVIRKAHMNGARLGLEALIDPQRLEALGQQQLLADLREGKSCEVSVGAFVTTAEKDGVHNGRQYKAEWLEIAPDHLAFLPNGTGACSIAMGCGAHRAAMHLVTAEGFELVDAGSFLDTPAQAASEEDAELVQYETMQALLTQVGAAYAEAAALVRQLLKDNGGTDEQAETELEASRISALQTLLQAMQGSINVVSAMCFKANPAIYPGMDAKCCALTTLEGDSLTERISKVNAAVDRKWNAPALAPPSNGYAYADQVFDSSCIVRKGEKFFAVPYDVMNDDVVFGEPVEVKQEYVAAAQKDCDVCDGSGKAGGKDCEACGGLGQMKTAAGARHSEGDRQMIQMAHDHMVKLGAECGLQLREASNPEGINQYTKGGSKSPGEEFSDRLNHSFTANAHDRAALAHSWAADVYRTGTSKQAKEATASAQAVSEEAHQASGKAPSQQSVDGKKTANTALEWANAATTSKYADHTISMHEKAAMAHRDAAGYHQKQLKTAQDAESGQQVAETELRAACSCQKGDSHMTKEAKALAIKALIENPHSGFAKGDEPILEAATDERLEAFTTAAAARTLEATALKTATDAVAAKDAEIATLRAPKQLTTEEFMAVAPPEVKTLVENKKAADVARKIELVTVLKAAQAEFTEAELSAMPLDQLERHGRMLKIAEPAAQPTFVRAVPRVAAANNEYAAPDAYAAGITALQAQQH